MSIKKGLVYSDFDSGYGPVRDPDILLYPIIN